MKIEPHYSLRGFPITGESSTPFCSHWLKHYFNPMTYVKGVRYFFQRGWRGYADCDYWDADGYFEHVMLGVIKNLRERTQGYPAGLVSDSNLDIAVVGAEHLDGMVVWHGILDEIILGLEAAIDLKRELTVPDGVYSDAPLEWEPLEGQDGFVKLVKLVETDEPRFNKDLYETWAEPLRKRKKRAAVLLLRHWGSFWD